ncbi:MAG TPA: pantetheine-phosphate adenylyltransferase [bacterium]|nr:MAG: Phosphopantetheine adenylyltransferase [bacterium ADurb.Bin236]HOC92091.1 pantetheine-phosphate adenylyltransferase [bacterium]HOY62275.1 pantetheine-phosphate adenylyltransferase [bacterium]HPI75564.1 pantetheine-phosphate adenylyltransferase [bacterium]HPN93476.1 pantetheine-phosphate adenylyltransferase [bacterium]
MNIAAYPGSFDPITNGHMDIVQRSASVFDELIVAISNNPSKKHLFSIQERLEIAKELTKGIANVKVESFDTLLVDYVKACGAKAVVRGLRAVTDFEMEFQMALVNKRLAPNVETVFLVTSTEHSFISSSIIKEVASFGGDVSSLVSPLVDAKLKERFSKK